MTRKALDASIFSGGVMWPYACNNIDDELSVANDKQKVLNKY